MTRDEFIKEYVLRAATGTATARGSTKPKFVIEDALEAWEEIEALEPDRGQEAMKRARSKEKDPA